MNFLRQIKKYALPITVVLAVSAFGQSSVSVNVGGANAVVNKEIFGGLMERLGRGINGGIFVGTNATIPHINGMRKDIIDGLIECGFGAIQWPGGCAAQGYNWNPPNPSNDLGTDRFMQLCSLTTCTPVLTGRSNNTYAASNKAWVRYINQNSAHPSWTIKYFQLGNEVWGCGGSFSCWSNCSAPYKPHYNANYDSLKVTVNNKPITTIAGTDGIWRFQQWLKDMLADNVNRIENIEIHDYIYFPDNVDHLAFTDAQYYDILNRANESQMRPRLDEIISILNQYDPGNRIKIWEGEWGNWLIDDGDGWRQAGTLMDALSAGETLNLFVRYAHRMLGAGIAQVINVIHSIMNTESAQGALVKTPTFYVFKMYKPHQNAKYAPTTITSARVNNIPAITAAATVNSQGRIHLSLTNIDLTNNQTVNITLTGTNDDPAIVSGEIITGPAKNSTNPYNGAEVVNIKSFTDFQKTGTRTYRVTMPPRSIVMLAFGGTTEIKPEAATLRRAAHDFSVRGEHGGRIVVAASVAKSTPVTIEVYGVDGKTLVERTHTTFEAGTSTRTIMGDTRPGRGLYLVKIAGNGVCFARQVFVAR